APEGHLVGGERQVVWTGLDRDGQAPRAGLGERRERLGGREVDDVDSAAGVLAQGAHLFDRGDLPARRSRGEIGSVVAGVAPRTPAATSGASSRRLPGTTPPQKATSTKARGAASGSLAASASLVVVTGVQLSGMSTMVVMPPAAAARVAEAKPSQAVRPGSLT